MHQGNQVLFRISRGNLGFLLTCCSRKGPHLAMMGEPCGFSRVTGFSTYDRELREPLVDPQGSPICIQVARGSRGLLSSHCRANRPHLGMCPQIPCSFPVATGISGLPSRFTQGVRPRSSGSKELRSPLELEMYVRELFELHQGCQAPPRISRGNVGFLLRCCTGKGPHLEMTGELRGILELQRDS